MRPISKLKEDARKHELREEWEKAIQVYLQVLAVGEQGEGEIELPLYNRVGDLYVRLGRAQEAVRHYEQAADRYAEAGLYNNAIALCNKAMRYNPQHVGLLRKLGVFSALQGFNADARRYFGEYFDRQVAQGKVDEALHALSDFARIADDADAHELLGHRLQEHGRTAEAVVSLRAALAFLHAPGNEERAASLRADIERLDPGPIVEEQRTSGPPSPEPLDSHMPGLSGFDAEPLEETISDADDLTALPIDFAAADSAQDADIGLIDLGDFSGLERGATGTVEGLESHRHDVGDPPSDAQELESYFEIEDEEAAGEADELFELPLLDDADYTVDESTVDSGVAGFDRSDVEAPAEARAETDLRAAVAPIAEEHVDVEAEQDDLGDFEISDDLTAEPTATDDDLADFGMDAAEAAGASALADDLVALGTGEHEAAAAIDAVDESDDFGLDQEAALPGSGDISDDIGDFGLDDESTPPVTSSLMIGAAEPGEEPRLDDFEFPSFAGTEASLASFQDTRTAEFETQFIDETAPAADVLSSEPSERTLEIPGLTISDGEIVENVPGAAAEDRASLAGWPEDPEDDWNLAAADAAVEEPASQLLAGDDTVPLDFDIENIAAVEAVAEAAAGELAEALEADTAEFEEEWDEDLAEPEFHHEHDAQELETTGLHAVPEFDIGSGEALPAEADDIAPAWPRVEPPARPVVSSPAAWSGPRRVQEPPADADRSSALAATSAAEVEAVSEAVPLDADRSAPPDAVPGMREGDRRDTQYVDLGSLLSDEEDEETTTRFQIDETSPTGDEDQDFAELLSRFKQKVAEHLPPEDAAAHYDLGLAFKEMGLIDEAIGEFQVALRSGHMRLKVYEELGYCFLYKQQYNIAEKVLRQALQVEHEHELELLGIYYQLGRAYEAMGRREQARDAYERVLGMDLNFQDVSDRLARL